MSGEDQQYCEVEIPTQTEINNISVNYGYDYFANNNINLLNIDVKDSINKIPNDIQLLLTSPPYNLGKPYESKKDIEDYKSWIRPIFTRLVDKISEKGSLCIEIGNYVKDNEIFPLDYYFYELLSELKLSLRNRIVWRYGHGLHCSKRFSGRYEIILWFTKSDDYVFNLDDVRIKQKYPGKTKHYGPNTVKPSGNPLGKNPSDMWEFLAYEWDFQVWNIPNVKANHIEKTIHTCQFPIELAERLILALSNEDDVVFDPFVGVGSTLIASQIHNRKSIGVDREKTYTDITYYRILQMLNGKLRKRELAKPVYVPNPNSKVATIPDDWKKYKIWHKN
jgi:adenine-specific DNA-methyltransferase